ncbi:GAF domain-containing protein [Pseudonocardia sp. RS11V-5]|uniref:helix-turn-helix domain-containing protein n=1 Tax=Pseudonocardia terrae TaxID=2905831 RepID=UPI001E3A2457|nr:GAF domain-containing protein [Pseudonocardia terrae]MCE3555245.1 GAF domain-containing protein [Pseudonocardia terrae]
MSPLQSPERPVPATPVAETLTRVVALLADDAPAGAVTDAVAGLPGEPLAARAAADALAVRDLLDLRRRREREGAALNATARDLTSLRSSGEVLRAIVERARRLLGSDSAYIALVDEATGDAYMRVTAGTRTDGIRAVRQRPGYGVGGYVIQTGQALATSDYLVDERIRHDPLVAAAVGADGIVSIAGVPMRTGSTVIGALFAAHRVRRDYDQAEIALLSSLAAHASVVIENARLYERIQSVTAELREAGARLAAQRHALERAAFAHEQLMPLALERTEVAELVRVVRRILGGGAVLLAGDGRVLAECRDDSGRAPADLQAHEVEVRVGEESLGCLRLLRRGPLSPADERTLERAAQTAALLLVMDRQAALVAREVHAELLADLVADRAPDWAVLQRRAVRSGIADFERPHSVVVAGTSRPQQGPRALPGPDQPVLGAAVAIAERYGGLAGVHGETIVLLLPGLDPDDAARLVVAELSAVAGRPVTAGAAGPGAGARVLRGLHRSAARCHRLLLALGREGQGAALPDLGMLGTVLETADPRQIRGLLDRTLGPVTAYDRANGSSLLATVEAYFSAGQSPPATARALGIHVNTVYQRLDRITDVLGGRRWREPAGAVEMQLALALNRQLGEPLGRAGRPAAASGWGGRAGR